MLLVVLTLGYWFFVSRYLSYVDRTGEIVVVIINCYVALSKLDNGFTYIVLGAV
jgi:hypothetical protein